MTKWEEKQIFLLLYLPESETLAHILHVVHHFSASKPANHMGFRGIYLKNLKETHQPKYKPTLLNIYIVNQGVFCWKCKEVKQPIIWQTQKERP